MPPTALVVASRAHSGLLLLPLSPDNVAWTSPESRQRAACSKLLRLVGVYQNAEADDNGRGIVPAVLVGGICPHLSSLSLGRNADCIEIFRDGLSALLPVFSEFYPPLLPTASGCATDEGEVRGAQECGGTMNMVAASSIPLVSLMMGSWLIVDRHGGKIVSALLTCLGRIDGCTAAREDRDGEGPMRGVGGAGAADDDDDDNGDNGKECNRSSAVDLVAMCVVQAASVALVLGGDRADEVLSAVEEECVPGLVRRCREIRCAGRLLRE